MSAFMVRALRLASFSLILIVAQAEAGEARAWLERMNHAVDDLNYKGTFVHIVGGNAETMTIVHRNHDGEIGERLVSLDGAGREIIARKGHLQVILPDRDTVLVKPKGRGSLIKALPSYSTAIDESYAIKLYKTARVADRTAQVIAITPKDHYRYGYVVWLDEDTAYPLKSQLRDEHNRTIEQILFTQISMYDSIPATAIEPTIDTQGFTVYQSPRVALQPVASVPWRVSVLPEGFQLSAAMASPMGDSKYPVEHLVYSDGLATVSVFIEDPKAHSAVTDGFSHVGSSNTYTLMLAGRQVTVMGEVPKMTVHVIAMSLRAE